MPLVRDPEEVSELPLPPPPWPLFTSLDSSEGSARRSLDELEDLGGSLDELEVDLGGSLDELEVDLGGSLHELEDALECAHATSASYTASGASHTAKRSLARSSKSVAPCWAPGVHGATLALPAVESLPGRAESSCRCSAVDLAACPAAAPR